VTYTSKTAVITPCGTYRYRLERIWDPEKKKVAFIGLNPSTADANLDDPTIRKCVAFADRWGYGGIIMVNLFAYRATEPKVMMAFRMARGPENAQHIEAVMSEAAVVIAAWGANGTHLGRDLEVKHMFRMSMAPLHYLRLNAGGTPAHPLYLPGKLEPQLWNLNG
jgi:hypothetical protein